MAFLLQMVALLAVAAGTLASDFQCYISNGYMNCNNLEMISPPAGYWPHIFMLQLSQNPIPKIPRNSLSGFPDLEYITLANNYLTEIDFSDLVALTKLSEMIFIKNKIETLLPPVDGETLDNLLYMYIYENNISRLDPDFFQLYVPNLIFLSMNNNSLEVDPGQPIFNHEKLASLYVGIGSNFGAIDSTFFSGLPSLYTLSLRAAKITSVEGAFVNNQRLAKLDLTGNGITQITSATFASEEAITELKLDDNPLTTLNMAVLNEAMGEGSKLSIANTPLACNCAYEELYWWALNKGVSIVATCSGQSACGFDRRRSPAASSMAEEQMKVNEFGFIKMG